MQIEADDRSRCVGLQVNFVGLVGNEPRQIGHILAPHARIWVVTLSALYRAVVLQERRRRNDVKRSQLPLAAPVQIHDRERARQTGVCLVERAILLDLESG